MGNATNYPCPACGYLVFGEPVGSYDICPICNWEDDPVQLQHPDLAGGANKVSLIEAQKNFVTLGAIEDRYRNDVRAPGAADIKDLKWRPWNPMQDSLAPGAIRTGKDYFDAMTPADDALSKDPNALYYWLR
jgi:cysteine-rich CPCC protein